MTMNKALFLDRDGVINHGGSNPITVKDLKIIPEAIEALKKVPQDYKKIIITNQSWVSHGMLEEEELHKVHEMLIKELASHGITIDDVYSCIHKSKHGCDCRKPKPGMFHQAQEKHSINIEESFMIGDMITDIEAGKNAGCKKSILIKRDHSYILSPDNTTQPDHTVNTIIEAVDIIFDNLPQ